LLHALAVNTSHLGASRISSADGYFKEIRLITSDASTEAEKYIPLISSLEERGFTVMDQQSTRARRDSTGNFHGIPLSTGLRCSKRIDPPLRVKHAAMRQHNGSRMSRPSLPLTFEQTVRIYRQNKI
jgi:hypothetical protein